MISYDRIIHRLTRLTTAICFFLSLDSCQHTIECNLKTIIPHENSDSLKYGELYQAEIVIPEFDSTLGYQCIIGDYDTLIDATGCKLILDTTKTYFLLNQPRSFNDIGTYVILAQKEKIGRHEFQGFISYIDKNGKEKFLTFKCDYYVYDE